MKVSDARRIEGVDLAAWSGFLRAHSRIVGELDRELEAAHGLSVRAYEVLLHLGVAPERRLKMSLLASSVLLSQSGVTRLVDRLERDGLVRRDPCSTDRRVLYATLTAEGLETLRAASVTHVAGVRRLFLDPARDELETLARVWDELAPA